MMKYFYIFGIMSLTAVISIPNVFAGDRFNLDVDISQEYTPLLRLEENDIWYKLQDNKNLNLDISNSSIICPSNQCGAIPSDMTFSVAPDSHFISLHGTFRLVDDKSNGHFTPKKQEFVEGMQLDFYCTFNDIQEDVVKNTAKYICSEPHSGDITRVFNDTVYPYTFTGTFETPTGHVVLNAIEEHENPEQNPQTFGKHLVFRNEDGQIEVR